MAAPNLVNVSAIYGKTTGAVLSATVADLLVNSAASNKVLKVNACYVANTSTTTDIPVTLNFYDASSATSYQFFPAATIPFNAAVNVISKDSCIYLEEGDKITGFAGTASTVHAVLEYEEIA